MKKKIFILLVIIIEIIYIWNKGQMVQNLEYHNFADSRSFWGVQNFFDVLSNLPFFIVGALGFFDVYKNSKKIPNALSWMFLFAGVFLVAPGSMYYHWNPSNETLVWDRLPMTIGFMALNVALISLYFPNKFEKIFLPLGILAGFGSIYYWVEFDDLRVYAIVQLTAIIIIPLLVILYKHPKVKREYLFGAFAFYLMAKVTETFDTHIFEVFPISGHTIKHFLAAIAVFYFLKLVRGLKV